MDGCACRGRGRGRRGGGQQPPVSSQNIIGRGNVGQPSPRVAVQQTSMVRDFENLVIGSSTTTLEPVVATATVAGPIRQQPMQHLPVQTSPEAMVASQQQAAPMAPSQAVPLVPSSSRMIKAPTRNGFGTAGRKCVIRENHFLVDIGQKDPHHYDATIAPEVTSKIKCREIMKFLIESYRASHLGNLLLAYDGKKSAFVARALPFESKEFVVKIVENNGRECEFKVTIKFVARKDVHHLKQFLSGRQPDCPQETIQALDVILRESASQGRKIVGRSLFSCEFGHGALGDGIEFWKGFYQSLRPTQMRLSLNVDMSARAFYQPTLASEFVSEFFNKDITRPLSNQERIKVKKALRGVRLEVRRQDYMRRYKVQELSVQPQPSITQPTQKVHVDIPSSSRQAPTTDKFEEIVSQMETLRRCPPVPRREPLMMENIHQYLYHDRDE
ncbi:protein argonaute 1-like [Cynara cardunculus var. scolymus]|uniref:protein argonaute 1-like n=1 Tax=Cynara cardunculus var. scolymus TaxID=59895 RepID=UPI000D62BD05|nr:protein argonaute 1-like [Cynara cardunculus var. scolymus]